MEAQGLDALLAFAAGWRRENVPYFTDAPVAGSASFALVAGNGAVSAFSTRRADLHTIAARGWVTDTHTLDVHAPAALTGRLRDLTPARLGVAHYELLPQLLADGLRGALPDAQIISATGLMDDMRLVKSEWEIGRMRQVDAAVAAGWRAFVDVLEPGLPEYAIVAAVEAAIKEQARPPTRSWWTCWRPVASSSWPPPAPASSVRPLVPARACRGTHTLRS